MGCFPTHRGIWRGSSDLYGLGGIEVDIVDVWIQNEHCQCILMSFGFLHNATHLRLPVVVGTIGCFAIPPKLPYLEDGLGRARNVTHSFPLLLVFRFGVALLGFLRLQCFTRLLPSPTTGTGPL